jgi:hypothetical protein
MLGLNFDRKRVVIKGIEDTSANKLWDEEMVSMPGESQELQCPTETDSKRRNSHAPAFQRRRSGPVNYVPSGASPRDYITPGK